MKKEEIVTQQKLRISTKINIIQEQLKTLEDSLNMIDLPNEDVKNWSTMKFVKYFVIFLIVITIIFQILLNFIPKHEFIRPY